MRAPNTYTDIQASRHATFQAATYGLGNWKIAKAMNVLRPGHDFRGCNKSHMIKAWCEDEWFLKQSGRELREAISEVSA